MWWILIGFILLFGWLAGIYNRLRYLRGQMHLAQDAVEQQKKRAELMQNMDLKQAAENRFASLNQAYLDSIELYNSALQEFPASLFASIVGKHQSK